MAEVARSSGMIVLSAATGALALVLSVMTLARQLPPELWVSAMVAPDVDDIRQLLVHLSWLPRVVTSLLAGATLALAGTLFQQLPRRAGRCRCATRCVL